MISAGKQKNSKSCVTEKYLMNIYYTLLYYIFYW